MHPSRQHTPFGPGLALLVALGFFSPPGSAQAEGLRYTVGLIAGAGQSPFEKDGTESGLIPDFLIEGDRLSFGTSGLTYKAIDSGVFTLSARLAPRWFVADPTEVAGLEQLERDIAIEAGLSARFAFGNVQAEIEMLQDVSDTHGGMAVTAALSTGFSVSDRFMIGARMGATWMDADLATYSYGVLPAEASGSLAAYRVRDSVIPSIGINASYAFADHVSLTGGVETSFLPDSVTNSPIVKRDTLTSVVVGLRYAF
ncbi:MipA/OmpV family protein [Tabrizicola sp.]|uniref:MipA/OmpV family protein n=1 Tax=Tabrizicola sp. TaxID=2005166 RepID=UPI00273367BC|nr:MipA/OmpV family protein [Tabrizicola sp.]MDP3194747.1 MipA/OmpV family protein [Tabrizicola sp.]